MSSKFVVVTVPGLRGHVEDHWQTRLASQMPNVHAVPPLGRDNPSLDERVEAIQETLSRLDAPVILVAHSAGVLTAVHWALRYEGRVAGALLATPPDLSSGLPAEYPSLDGHGWTPIPMRPLPFPSIVAASANDPLGDPARVRAMAQAWGSEFHSLGAVGHLNPASGFGPWCGAVLLIGKLNTLEISR